MNEPEPGQTPRMPASKVGQREVLTQQRVIAFFRDALDYKAYLEKLVELTRRVGRPDGLGYPLAVTEPARRALYDNLKGIPELATIFVSTAAVVETRGDVAEQAACAVDAAIRAVKKADWRDNRFKEREVRNAIKDVLRDDELVDRIFAIVKARRDY